MTSENVAAKYGISRDLQDKMAVSSHQRAAKARDTGRFKDEIVPVKTSWKDPKTGMPCTHCYCQVRSNQSALPQLAPELTLVYVSKHLSSPLM